MKRTLILTAVLAVTATVFAPVMRAQDATKNNPCTTPVKHRFKKAAPACDDLREKLNQQQAEIDELKRQIAAQQPAAAPAAVPETDPVATPLANKAESDAQAASSSAAAASANADAAKAAADKAAADAAIAKKEADELESPIAIHYKNVLITPGGFFAAESVFRTRTMNSNIATPFNSVPYGNSNNYYISEFNGSVGQSRLSLGVKGKFDWGTAGGYVETDFLGAGTTSNNNQTNSYVLRVRSAFGQATLNSGFSFQGGQMFTLATEVKKGILAGQSAEALPPTIDPNYIVGFNFGRQYALRFAQSFAGGKANAAFAVEGSQIIFAATGNAPSNFFFGGAGAAGGLFNSTGSTSGGGSAAGATAAAQNYTDNLAPDLHLKFTFDPGHGHFEVGGILRFFRDRVYGQGCSVAIAPGGFCPAANVTTTAVGTNYTTPGGGGYISARVPITKYFDYGLKVYGGPGMARYEASNLGDVTVRPSGQLEPLKTYGGLTELDFHPTPKLDIFALEGAAYLQRTTYISPLTGLQVGYAGVQTQNDSGCHTQAAPVNATGYGYNAVPSCSGATRYLSQTAVGMTYRFFNSPTKGRMQAQIIYEYLDRMAWQGYTGASYAGSVPTNSFDAAQGINNMVHTSIRYYLP